MRRPCLLLLMLACPGFARAEVFDQLEYANYSARASASTSLLKVLLAASPIRDHGETFIGHTAWNIKWNYWWNQTSAGNCKINRVEVRINTLIRLPALHDANSEQNRRFEKFLAALRQHELGHYENGKAAAQEIDQGILALPAMSNCKELESQANQLGHRILRKYNERDVQYDASTGHGKTQGAWID